MKRLGALSVMVLLLSGCSQKAAFEEVANGACSSAQAQLVDAHISAQIDAMAQQDWKLAYSFASPGFRSGVDIEDFIFIISTQYGMLLDNQGYAFNACTIADEKITQEVEISTDSEVFTLYYILSVTGGVLGVDSSSSNLSENKLEA